MKLFKKILLFFWFHQRDYKKVLEHSSFEDESDKKSFDFVKVRYQAYASFYTKNYYHSNYCFELLAKHNKLTSKDYNYIAFLHARHNEREKAISSWCIALEKNSRNKIAKKALDYLRDKGSDFILTEDDFFSIITPKEPFVFPIRFFLKIFSIILITTFLTIFAYRGFIVINEIIKEKKRVESLELNKVTLPDFNTNLLEKQKDALSKYSYNEKEIKDKFDNIKRNILKNRVVEAQIEINEILLSNASLNVKIKTEMLKSFIQQPDYSKFNNIVTFEMFNKEKRLYKDVYVLWDGVIKNQIIKKDKITFNLFIGNDEKGVIIGIMPVVFSKAHLYKNNDKVHVFGKIIEDGADYILQGLYIIDSNQFFLYKKR